MCETDNEESAHFEDGGDKANATLISKDKYTYNVRRWRFSNRGGNVFSFGRALFCLSYRLALAAHSAQVTNAVCDARQHACSQPLRACLRAHEQKCGVVAGCTDDSTGLVLSPSVTIFSLLPPTHAPRQRVFSARGGGLPLSAPPSRSAPTKRHSPSLCGHVEGYCLPA